MSLLATSPTHTAQRAKRTYDPFGSTEEWAELGEVRGWLDLITGTDLPTGGGENAFVEESTHVLITDGIPTLTLTDADRIVSHGVVFNITYVDDVTQVGDHLEIYLRKSSNGAR